MYCKKPVSLPANESSSMDDSLLTLIKQWGSNRMCEIKRHLEQGADIHYVSYTGETYLMRACNEGDVPLVNFLLSKGVQVSACDNNRNTALHYCCMQVRNIDQRKVHKCLEIIKSLLNHKAVMLDNYQMLSPIKIAALYGNREFVDFFMELPVIPELHKIEALELLDVQAEIGSLANFQYKEDWFRALEMREALGFPKSPMNMLQKFGLVPEFTSKEDLMKLLHKYPDIRIQAILIAHRIMGPLNVTAASLIFSEVASKRSKLDLKNRLEMLSYLLQQKEKLLLSFSLQVELPHGKDLVLSCRMIMNFFKNKYTELGGKQNYLLEFYDYAIDHLYHCSTQQYFCENLTSLCQFVHWIINTLHFTYFSERERRRFEELTRILLRKNEKSKKMSWLRMVLDHPTRYSRKTVTSLIFFLECGADPNELDQYGYYALHALQKPRLQTEKDEEEISCCKDMLKVLLEFGAHIDAVGQNGKLIDVSSIIQNVNLSKYITLQCISCQVIKKYGLDYSGLPESLQKLVTIH